MIGLNCVENTPKRDHAVPGTIWFEVVRRIRDGIRFQEIAQISNRRSCAVRIDAKDGVVCASQSMRTTGTRLNEVPGNYLDATGISFDAGIMVVRAKSIYVKLDYEYFQPTLKASPDLIKALYTEGIIMPETRKLDCSTINLSVGVNLNFKQ